jgi:glycosyltransferase involved in cell wall biosynthesis
VSAARDAPLTLPFFSVAMPAYNAEATIARAIESVLAQSYGDWELVVVDDGSTDATSDIVARYRERDTRVKLVRQDNAGCGAARDTAIRGSEGTYIVRLDADDVLLPQYMERMHAFILGSPGYDIYSCNGYHVYPDGSKRLARLGPWYEEERSFKLEEMLFATHIFTMAVFTRALFDRVGGIRPDVYCEDLDFWLRAFAQGATHRYTPQALAVYEVSDSQMTADFSRVAESRAGIYRDLIATGLLTSEQERLANRAIEKVREDERVYRWRSSVKAGVSRILGEGAGDAVSRAMHATAGWLRPPLARLARVLPRRGDSR